MRIDFVFGYVTVLRSQMTEEEYEVFCSYYCGVCKAMGKRASQISRLGLSYDIAFLALVLASVAEDEGDVKYENCVVHPFKKRKCVKNSVPVEYAAQMGVLLDYLKLDDDWRDDRSFKSLIGKALLYSGYSRVKRRYPAQITGIKNKLEELNELERENCPHIDEVAHCFGSMLENLFVPDFIKDEKMCRALRWLGYNLGRWIYIIDAYNDIEDDRKTRSYNPFIAAECNADGGSEDYRSTVELSLTFTLENIASAYELINFKRNKDIIGKIIYLSLNQKQSLILSGEEQKTERKCVNRRNRFNESI